MHLMFRFRAQTSRVWVILREKNKFVKKKRKKDKLDISLDDWIITSKTDISYTLN